MARPEPIEALPALATARLTLRRISQDDATALFRVFGDPETMRYWSDPPHSTEGDTRAMIARIHEGLEDGSVLQWALERDEDGAVLGTITLMPFPGQPRAEIGFILGRAHWGHGYAAEAQRRVISFAFEELGMHRIEADAHPDNDASLRSLRRLGFRDEGVLRERWVVAGEASDSAILGLLRSEWPHRGVDLR